MSGPRRRAAALLVATTLVIAIAPSVGVAALDPRIISFVPSPNLDPGTTETLTVQFVNEDRGGRDVLTAENLRVTLESGDTPIAVESGTIVADDLPDGGVASVDFRVRVPEGTEPGRYRLPVELEYIAEDEGLERTQYVTVRVQPVPRFEVVSTATNASVGDRGTLSVVLRNAGTATARDATVTLASEDPAIAFGGGALARSYVGRVRPGGEARVEVDLDVAAGAGVRPYAIGATVAYEGSRGEERSQSFPLAVTPRGEPTFAVESATADLRVGDRGTIVATIQNTGESAARDATVLLTVPWANVTDPIEYPLGDLAAGASASASFTSDVPVGLEPGPKRVWLRVEHARAGGERRRSDPLGARVEVGPRRAPIAVEPENATFEVDGAGRLEVRLTNRAGGPVTDLRATLTATEPLSSEDPAAFVPRLAAGESTTVAFHLEVSDDAVPGSHPVSVSLAYDDASGNARRVEDVPVGVTVVEQPGSEFPVAAAVAVALVLAAGALWWYRRG